MPSEELRLKLREAKERKESEALPGRLPGVRCHGYRQATDIPDWIPAKIGEVTKTTSVPTATIGDSATHEQLDRWIETFARDHGLGTHVLLRTGMRLFPWLDCHLPENGWATTVRETLGGDFFLASMDGSTLIVIFEEEYAYDAFAAHGPPRQ